MTRSSLPLRSKVIPKRFTWSSLSIIIDSQTSVEWALITHLKQSLKNVKKTLLHRRIYAVVAACKLPKLRLPNDRKSLTHVVSDGASTVTNHRALWKQMCPIAGLYIPVNCWVQLLELIPRFPFHFQTFSGEFIAIFLFWYEFTPASCCNLVLGRIWLHNSEP